MELHQVASHWEAFARSDPRWAILTAPDKRGNRWDPVEFFATGVAEIRAVIGYLAQVGVAPARGAALDFGCGVGRLTQALCEHFDDVYGVDIAPTMIARAREFNRFGGRCRYLLNDRNDLACIGDESLDFVYSNIVLQHVEPRFAERYVREFSRVLRPTGVVLFQLPAERVSEAASHRARPARVAIAPAQPAGAARLLDGAQRSSPQAAAADQPRMEMWGTPRHVVETWLCDIGLCIADVNADASAGPAWRSYRYCAVKP